MNRFLQITNNLIGVLFFWKKPKVVVVTPGSQDLVNRAVARVLGLSFVAKKEVLVVDWERHMDLPKKGWLVLNFDQENIRQLQERAVVKVLTFGFQKGADFQATDIRKEEGINFKVNYQGTSMPFWLDQDFNREAIYAALAAVAVATVFGFNLVEISQALKGGLTSVRK